MTSNPMETGPHDPDAPPTPDEDDVRTDIPGVDPDWPQTVRPPEEPA